MMRATGGCTSYEMRVKELEVTPTEYRKRTRVSGHAFQACPIRTPMNAPLGTGWLALQINRRLPRLGNRCKRIPRPFFLRDPILLIRNDLEQQLLIF